MISKELLSEVIKKPIGRISFEENINYYWKKTDTYCGEINIYELAHKCKEWALSKDYHINTSEDRFNNYLYLYKMFKDDFGYSIDKNSGVQFDSNDYINDLIKACEWILENKGIK